VGEPLRGGNRSVKVPRNERLCFVSSGCDHVQDYVALDLRFSEHMEPLVKFALITHLPFSIELCLHEPEACGALFNISGCAPLPRLVRASM
jgi:hypothetical protein